MRKVFVVLMVVLGSLNTSVASQRLAYTRRPPSFNLVLAEALGARFGTPNLSLLTTTGLYGGIGLPVTQKCEVSVQGGVSILAGSPLPGIRFTTGFGCSVTRFFGVGLQGFVQDSGLRQSFGVSGALTFKVPDTWVSLALMPNITCSMAGCTYFGAVGIKISFKG